MDYTSNNGALRTNRRRDVQTRSKNKLNLGMFSLNIREELFSLDDSMLWISFRDRFKFSCIFMEIWLYG